MKNVASHGIRINIIKCHIGEEWVKKSASKAIFLIAHFASLQLLLRTQFAKPVKVHTKNEELFFLDRSPSYITFFLRFLFSLLS